MRIEKERGINLNRKRNSLTRLIRNSLIWSVFFFLIFRGGSALVALDLCVSYVDVVFSTFSFYLCVYLNESVQVTFFYSIVQWKKKKFPWGYQSALPLERLLIHLEIICKLTLSPFCSVLFKRYLFWWGRCYESMRIHE